MSKATSSAVAPAAKGQLVVGSGVNTAGIVGVGANDTVLTADSSTATGLKWAAASSGLTLIRRASFSSVANTGTTFDGVFTTAYQNYVMVIDNCRASTAGYVLLNWRVSGATQSAATFASTIYMLSNASGGGWVEEFSVSSGTAARILATSASTTRFANATYDIFGVGNGSTSPWTVGNHTSAQNARAGFGWSYYETLINADGIIFTASTGNISGTVSIYGRAI